MKNRKQALTLIIIFTITALILTLCGLKNLWVERNIIQFQPDNIQKNSDNYNLSATTNNQEESQNTLDNHNHIISPAIENQNEKEPKNSAMDSKNKVGVEKEIQIQKDGNSDSEVVDSYQSSEAINEKETSGPSKTTAANTVNILFLGIDRTEEREETSISFGSDTIILAQIDLDKRKMKALSIPRDTYAYIPVRDKKDKICYAYAYGFLEGKAVKSAIDAISYLVQGARIVDYYFTLDMEPIPEMIDKLGGVELNVEIDMKSHGADLSKGMQLLDGDSAFDYIHWRYAEDGDIGRIKRQQKFVMAMFSKLKTTAEKEELMNIILSNEQYIDSDMGIEQLANIIHFISDLGAEDIQFSILPGKADYMNNVSYWIPDEEKCNNILFDYCTN